ncbi:carboxypeptidase M-like isoform X5 [Venturia canescens]|nr:carboxypeptidase M-like isoform X5 [Venturia canescens]XP_043282549.1 carboxypeptidase M-like isoform X5 [Venturia canescens]XP_043282550.1 carboxypeptidase M-like isoform X5 [Venturia canescens]XP_043282551.1 carboxypeptidase M-like isoform X5 [Venturia canescens]
MFAKLCVASVLLFACCYGAASGVAVSQEPIAQDEDIARHYNSRYSIFDEPYSIDFKYHNYEQMSRFLRATSLRFQNLTALYSIGKSVKGRDLWVMVVSSSPYEHMIGKPDVKYIANIHGNEAVGRELMLHLIHLLVTKYGVDPYITWLLDNTRIHILPSMNPDGFEVSKEGSCEGGQGRYNARGFDLNRNFPDYFKQNNKKSQPETEAVKEWVSKIQFVLSASLHGGALVASYPFDNTPNSRICRSAPLCAVFQSYSSTPSISPDDDVFRHLSLMYSRNHGTMHRGAACSPSQPGFKDGITNGAEWYPLTGGMQDFNYVWNGCMEMTLELSCCKYPPAEDLPRYWDENRVALIKFLAEAHRGIHGFVIDENGNPVERASVKIKTRDISFLTTKYGEFWRILLPGIYKLEVYANGYSPREVEFMVIDQHPTLLNVTLHATKNWGDDDDDDDDVWDLSGHNTGTRHRDVTQASINAAVSGSSVLGSNSHQKNKNTEGSRRPVDDHGANFALYDPRDAIIFPDS